MVGLVVENNAVVENISTKVQHLNKNISNPEQLDFNPLVNGGATAEEQERRIEKLNGKKLLWLTCHYTADLYAGAKGRIENVVSQGVKLFIVFGNTEKDLGLKDRMQADGFLTGGAIVCDMADVDNCVQNIYDAAVETGVDFDGVFSPHEQVQTLIGDLAERLNLPGNSKAAYCNARDKRVAREVCQSKNIPSPRFGKIKSEDEIDYFIDYIGLPLVLKPSAGGASEGVYKCRTRNEVYKLFDDLQTEMTTNKVFTWNPGCEMVVLVEEYIDGEEFDIDILMSNGVVVYCNVTDNWPTMEPTFLETGSNCPSTFSATVQQQLKDYSIQCVRALGFVQGAFHVECKYSMKEHRVYESEGEILGQPLLIEVNPRMGGGRTHKFNKECMGVDLFDNFVMTACGIPINPPKPSEPILALADYDVCCEVTGTLVEDDWLSNVTDHPNLVSHKYHAKKGKQVKGCDTGLPEWLATLIVRGDSADEAVE
eukprot:Awhi_evm1s15349